MLNATNSSSELFVLNANQSAFVEARVPDWILFGGTPALPDSAPSKTKPLLDKDIDNRAAVSDSPVVDFVNNSFLQSGVW